MKKDKGLSLIEMIVTFMIIAILTVIVVPNYFTYMQQGEVKAAQNNLITIYNAEKNYYFTTGSYCTATSAPTGSSCTGETYCGNNLTDLNCNLSLGIIDNYFTYQCTSISGFKCTATSVSANSFTLTVSNNSIVTPGGTNCSPPGTTSGCNPLCQYAAHPTYCPSTSN